MVSCKKLKGRSGKMNLKCKCGQAFSVFFEFRKAMRKKTHLAGLYVTLSGKEAHGSILIENISKKGLGFTALDAHHLVEGDPVKIIFVLDDKDKTRIKKPAVVMRVQESYIGCKFSELTENEQALDEYLAT
jgi:hypothetical protein